MCFLLKNYSLVEVVYLFIRCNKIKIFLWNANNTDINGVSKQNTYTYSKLLEKDNTGKEGVPTMSLAAFEFLFIDCGNKANNDVTTFLNLRFIIKQRSALFWKNITC